MGSAKRQRPGWPKWMRRGGWRQPPFTFARMDAVARAAAARAAWSALAAQPMSAPAGRPASRLRLAGPLAAALAASGATSLAAAPAAAEVLVALAVPASGRGAERGAAMRSGAERAIAALNAAGGIGGETVRLAIEDDGCAAPSAADAARRIVARAPALVLGHPCAGAAISAARIYGPSRALYIASATRHPGLTTPRPGPTIFRLDGRDDRQGTFAAEALQRLAGGGRVALVSDRTAYARRIVTEARTALLAAGVREPAMLTLVAGEKTYDALIGELVRSGATALLFAGFPLEGAIVLRQMRAAGFGAAFVGTDAVATREFVLAAGEAGAGALFIVPQEAPATAIAAQSVAQAGSAPAPSAPPTKTHPGAGAPPDNAVGEHRPAIAANGTELYGTPNRAPYSSPSLNAALAAVARRTEAAVYLWAEAARRVGFGQPPTPPPPATPTIASHPALATPASAATAAIAAQLQREPHTTTLGMLTFSGSGDAQLPAFRLVDATALQPASNADGSGSR